MTDTITRKDVLDFIDDLEERARNKAPTEKFKTITPALEKVKELIGNGTAEIKIEYDELSAAIFITTPELNFNKEQMETWRELMDMIDMVGVMPYDEKDISIELCINEVFDC